MLHYFLFMLFVFCVMGAPTTLVRGLYLWKADRQLELGALYGAASLVMVLYAVIAMSTRIS